jgi:predicted nucleic acid-binding protein
VNVYVESNFFLELVLQQEQVSACEEMLAIAVGGAVQLCVPAYAFLEPLETLARRRAEWRELSRDVDLRLQQFARTGSLQAEADALRGLILKASQLSSAREEAIRQQLLSVARVLPVDHAVLAKADELRLRFNLTMPDAVMLAAVLLDPALGRTMSIFVNRNRKDFDDPDIRSELGACDVIWSFDASLARIKAVTTSAGPPS